MTCNLEIERQGFCKLEHVIADHSIERHFNKKFFPESDVELAV